MSLQLLPGAGPGAKPGSCECAAELAHRARPRKALEAHRRLHVAGRRLRAEGGACPPEVRARGAACLGEGNRSRDQRHSKGSEIWTSREGPRDAPAPFSVFVYFKVDNAVVFSTLTKLGNHHH